ncbi:MAG: hypothetical protein ACLS85_06250 [Coprobacillus cateniformis]
MVRYLCSQTTIDEAGRRIYVGWMRMPVADEANWIGLITYPRVITYQNDAIFTNIHPSVDSLKKPATEFKLRRHARS